MKAAAVVLSAFFLFPISSAHCAWNWNGTLKARVQADNRYTRYVNRPEVFGEIWGSFQAFNKAMSPLSVENLPGHNVVTSRELNYGSGPSLCTNPNSWVDTWLLLHESDLAMI